MNPNVKFAERIAILATLDPVSVAASTVITSYVPMANFHSIAAVLDVGVFGASATVDVKLRQAQDAAGTGVKDITGKAITQLVAAGGNNRQAIVEVRGEEMDVTNGYAFVCASVTVGTAATVLTVAMFGVNPRYASAAAFNQTAVAQVV
jgi:hypothetical protein